MITKVKHWGNSLAIRVPKEIAQKASLGEGSEVVLSVKKEDIIVTKIAKKKETLCDLVAQITPQNKHKLIFSDTNAVGKELWQ